MTLVSCRPEHSISAIELHCRLASTGIKLYCLTTDVHMHQQLVGQQGAYCVQSVGNLMDG